MNVFLICVSISVYFYVYLYMSVCVCLLVGKWVCVYMYECAFFVFFLFSVCANIICVCLCNVCKHYISILLANNIISHGLINIFKRRSFETFEILILYVRVSGSLPKLTFLEFQNTCENFKNDIPELLKS